MLDSVVRPNGGGSAPMWSPALNVQRGGYVVSPADGEIYRRVAATGTSGTDPADDVVNYVAASYTRVTATPRGYLIPTNYPDNIRGITRTAQFDVAVGAKSTGLSIAGRGQLTHLGHYRSAPSSTKSCNIEIFADGRRIYENEFGLISSHYSVHVGSAYRFDVGGAVEISTPSSQGIQFRRSLVVLFTPTVGSWLGASDFIGYAVRSEA